MSLGMAVGRTVEFLQARLAYERRIASVLGVLPHEVKGCYAQLHGSSFFQEMLQIAGRRSGFFDLSMMSPLRAQILYVVCRLVRPAIVVETGVADGFSSSFILAALEENRRGSLYSIDLPNQAGQEVPKDKATGWVIPERLRARWVLGLGSSRELLPSLLARLKTIDVFFHDSYHCYENMIFEFGEATRVLRPGGILICDDITDNAAFATFCASRPCRSEKIFKTGIASV